MPGLGVFVNVVAIIIGTAIGLVFGGIIPERVRDTAFRAIGLATFIIGAGTSGSPFVPENPKPPVPPVRKRLHWYIDNANR